MLWFKKKSELEPSTSSVDTNVSQSKIQPSSQDRNILYSLGSVISVKPSERFDIRGDQQGHFLLTKGSANLLVNGSVDVKTIGEGQWISTVLLPKSGNYFLSLKSGQEFKLIYLSSASAGGIDADTRSQIEKSLREIGRDIKKSISRMESLEESIGEHVRYSLANQNRAILSQYGSSSFIKNAIDDISTLPMIAQKFIGLTLSESVSNAEVTAYIKSDPSLTSEVLKIVNSSYQGLRSKVQDINYAVLHLGLSQIFQIVISASLQSIASKSTHLSSIYEHSIIISNVASLLGVPREKRISPVLATIGILHDVGEILKFNIKEKRKDLDFLIDQLNGAKMGSMLLEKWGIPEPICKAIELHDQSYYTLPDEFQDEVRLAIACLHVGHSVCSFINDESLPSDPITQAYLSFLGFTGLNIEQLIRLSVVPELRRNANKLPVEVQVFFSI